MKRTYTIQENGQVTLPAKWREKHGLKKGDIVMFEETEEGLFISIEPTLLMRTLENIGDALREEGIGFEELFFDDDSDLR
jgi:AbrB family looped-hinge helix DNA binding protein